MTGITSLALVKPNNEGLVRALEDLLERAKEGDLVSLIWCGELTGNQVISGSA